MAVPYCSSATVGYRCHTGLQRFAAPARCKQNTCVVIVVRSSHGSVLAIRSGGRYLGMSMLVTPRCSEQTPRECHQHLRYAYSCYAHASNLDEVHDKHNICFAMCLTIFSACYGLHNRGKQFVGSFIGREFRAAAYSPARDVLDRTRLDYAKTGLASTAHHSAYGWPLQPTTAGTTMHGIAYDHLGCHFLMHLRTRSTEPHNRSQCVVSLSVGLHPTVRCCLLLLGTGKFRIGIPMYS